MFVPLLIAYCISITKDFDKERCISRKDDIVWVRKSDIISFHKVLGNWPSHTCWIDVTTSEGSGVMIAESCEDFGRRL